MTRFKIIHNITDGPNVNIYVDGKLTLSNIPYKKQTTYYQLSSGSHNIKIVANNKPLINKNITLSTTTDYTLIVHGNSSSYDLLVLTDDNQCPKGKYNSHLRFINASYNSPSVDVVVQQVSSIKKLNRDEFKSLNQKVLIFENVSYPSVAKKNVSGNKYANLSSGKYIITVRLTGTKNTVIDPIYLDLDKGEVVTVTMTGKRGDKKFPLGLIAMIDNSCPK